MRKVAPLDLLLPERRERIDRVIAARTRSLTVVLEHVHDPHNIGAALRTCECFGLQDLHVVEGPRSPYHPAPLVTQGAEKWIDVHRSKDIAETFAELKAAGYRVLTSRLDGAAIPLPALPLDRKLALVFGNEHEGVTDRAAALADGNFRIPMFGFTQSLNISVALAVSLSWLVLRRAGEGLPGDLDENEVQALRERFYVKAVNQRGRIYGGQTTRPPPRRYRNDGEEP
jgi:tRNA (guanosine-2'-O-)-methyltransferase